MSDNDKELTQAREEFEAAMQKWVRISRDDTDNYFFIQDYSIAVSSESMEPGLENMSYMNFITRPGMAGYSVVGLLKSALHFWLHQGYKE